MKLLTAATAVAFLASTAFAETAETSESNTKQESNGFPPHFGPGPEIPPHHINHGHHHCNGPTTITRTVRVHLPQETVCGTSTRTLVRTFTADGIVRYTRSTSLVSRPTTGTITSRITSVATVATTTRTKTRTVTVKPQWGFLPAGDTVYGWPEERGEGWGGERGWEREAGQPDGEAEVAARLRGEEKGKVDFAPERKEHWDGDDCE